jgi:hypothetical protein
VYCLEGTGGGAVLGSGADLRIIISLVLSSFLPNNNIWIYSQSAANPTALRCNQIAQKKAKNKHSINTFRAISIEELMNSIGNQSKKASLYALFSFCAALSRSWYITCISLEYSKSL